MDYNEHPIYQAKQNTLVLRSGKPISELTLDKIRDGEVTMDDVGISPNALRAQAEIARAHGRRTLAENFERAAELVHVPNNFIFEAYETLRAGRAANSDAIRTTADRLEQEFNAVLTATFFREAADAYDRRGTHAARF